MRLSTPFNGCGTAYTEKEKTIVFSNEVLYKLKFEKSYGFLIYFDSVYSIFFSQIYLMK
jgi:hypothetical protein